LKFVVFGNCITQMKVIVQASAKLGIQLSTEENRRYAGLLSRIPTGGDSWTPEVGRAIRSLWNDNGIRQAFEQRDFKYQLNDSAEYFFENIDRFLLPDYCPTEQDILRARVRTTGVEEAVYQFDDLSFRMMDVGGQRSERRKWIHCFDCVTAVIFVVALSEYDQTLREDDSQNRTKESLLLFDEINNSAWFADTPFLLFLNKIDLFEEKLKNSPLKRQFPRFKGGTNFDAACVFMRDLFLEVNTVHHEIYTHFTCAIDTKNIEVIFCTVRETILRQILNDLF